MIQREHQIPDSLTMRRHLAAARTFRFGGSGQFGYLVCAPPDSPAAAGEARTLAIRDTAMKPQLRIATMILALEGLLLVTVACSNKNAIIGLWLEPEGASVEFLNSSKIVIYPIQQPGTGTPLPTSIAGEYSRVDKSHLRISYGTNSVIAEYSLSKDTLKLSVPDDKWRTFTRVRDKNAWAQRAQTAAALSRAKLAQFQRSLAELPWTAELPKALEKAQSERKLVLLDFTGSDWCVWCRRFEEDILSQPEFVTYARTNLIMLLLDYPKAKEQTDDLRQRNAELKAKFKVNGFPTFVVLNSQGQEIRRQVGYLSGGPEAFITKLKQLKNQTP